MPTPLLRDKTLNFAHAFCISIPRPDLRGFSVWLLFAECIGSKEAQISRKIFADERPRKRKMSDHVFVRALCKCLRSDSKKGRELWPRNTFPSFNLNHLVPQSFGRHISILIGTTQRRLYCRSQTNICVHELHVDILIPWRSKGENITTSQACFAEAELQV